MKALVGFEVGFASHELKGAGVPIEVRRAGSSFLRRTLSTLQIELEPGDYVVSAVLPAGQELFERVSVPPEGTTVHLAIPPESRSPHESDELVHFTHGRRRTGTPLAPESDSTISAPLRQPPALRLFEGRTTRSEAVAVNASTLLQRQPSAHPIYRYELAADGLRVVQLWQTARPPQNLVVASLPTAPMLLFATAFQDGGYRIEAHLRHADADLLLRYTRQCDLRNAAVLAENAELQAEQLLQDKQADPVAAAVGACALLSAGSPDSLDVHWTENLARWFPWLPDGAALHGEHLARLGRHRDAAEWLCQVAERGLPLLSSAYFYALERLRLYSSLEPAVIDGTRIEAGLVPLEEFFSRFVDPTQPITTYPGADPNRPSDRVAFEPVRPDALQFATP